MTFKQRWYRFWLQIVYMLHLRWPATWVQRWIKGELHAFRKPLVTFDTPQAAERYAQERFHYRLDTGNLGGWVFPLDWVTDPEVFQARLDENGVNDGDCDDYHYWAAHVVAAIDDVDRVYLLSSGFRGGGHTTVVFRYREQWMHFDYRIYELNNPNDAPTAVAKRYAGEPVEVPWFVFETIHPPWRAAAIGPDKISSS